MTDPTPTWTVEEDGDYMSCLNFTVSIAPWRRDDVDADTHIEDDAFDALADVVRLHEGLVSCLRHTLDGWETVPIDDDDPDGPVQWFHPGLRHSASLSDAERVALDWLQETAT